MVLSFFLFFFKQKTAYELRISDWSSDVCSSDLIVAALAVKDWMVRTNTAGTLVIWPGVAEELLGGKARFVRAGVFKDVDAAIFSHVSSQLATAWGQPNGTGMVRAPYLFEGESAHAAGAPWRGRPPLDGLTAMPHGGEN